jgi:hypothetical protein
MLHCHSMRNHDVEGIACRLAAVPTVISLPIMKKRGDGARIEGFPNTTSLEFEVKLQSQDASDESISLACKLVIYQKELHRAENFFFNK